MYKIYLKQAINMLKHNKFFSIIYIVGTASAIVMVMMLAILYYLRTADIEPESNRDRMLIAKFGKVTNKKGEGRGTSRLSYPTIKECFYPMKTPEAVTGIVPVGEQSEFIQVPGNDVIYHGLVMGTDAAFWKVFQFTFLSGKPYTEEEFTSGIRRAVVCESLARRLFNTTEAAGKTFLLNTEEYTVAGVVRNPPAVARYCHAEMWVPYTTRMSLAEGGKWCDYVLGHMYVCILAKRPSDTEAIRKEADELCRRYNTTTANYNFVLNGPPDKVFEAYLHEGGDTWSAPNYRKMYIQIASLLLVLLLVPSINLSGMMASRMKKRMEELGIRKAFGAKIKTLLNQMLFENLLLTLLGGLLGLLVSYGLVYGLKGWLLGSYNWDGTPLVSSVELSPGMLINPAIFGYTLLFCLVLNLLSALLPAWRSLKRPIVDALNDK